MSYLDCTTLDSNLESELKKGNFLLPLCEHESQYVVLNKIKDVFIKMLSHSSINNIHNFLISSY